MKRVIINADDFGMSDGICRAILELLEEGAIKDTTVMTAFPGAIERMKRFDVASLGGNAGVHLQLTEGKPLSPPQEVPSLVDRQGVFRDPRVHDVDADDVAREWRLQIECAATLLGGAPTHIDTHHGVHRLPGLAEVYVELAIEFSVPFRGGPGPIADVICGKDHPCTRAVASGWSGSGGGAARLMKKILDTAADYPEELCVEVIAHPGYTDDELRAMTSLADRREDDLAAIRELAADGLLSDNGFELGSFSNQV